MTDILVFTDPHLGKNLVSHTTPESRRRLRDSLYEQVFGVLDRFPRAKKVCLGDLFDRFQNQEDVIWQGMKVTKRLDYLMAGNHDLLNDRDRIGTLQLLHKGDAGPIQLTPFGEAQGFVHYVLPGVAFLFVPHHSTDALFHESLKAASDWVRGSKPSLTRAYLCLHCNYDSGFATDDTALSLTRKQAKDLLDDGFDYLLIGHDHHPREDWEGRVIILGNTHPTGFGDITDKRVMLIRPDGRHEFHTVWLQETGYRLLDVNDLLAPDFNFAVLGLAQFVEITGALAASQVMDLARAVRKLWQSCQPYAVRNRVEVTKAGTSETLADHDFHQLDMVIRAELIKRADLVELFDAFWADTAPALQEEEA
jgi:DNA repair exonuclease SbcCD nuclease subunit